MVQLQGKILTDTWVKATWAEYLAIVESPEYAQAKCYYAQGRLRIEMSPLGNDHARDDSIIGYAIHLFAALKTIRLNGNHNCSYRQIGIKEIQPDQSYYIGKNAKAIPRGTKIIDLDQYPAPNLVIEIGDTSIRDDQGEKRLIYEDLGVEEYWIVDVQNSSIIALAMKNNGSEKITESCLLPGLKIKTLETALRKSWDVDHGEVGAWLMSEFQK
ncbi:MAG: Uma2 family endonuclease [Gomphosphaeria aponina SAG 52.96 = DSM 107014]|uniref:Uma2 family endonuclease n=1 Tax=Gomphosphaeria aponina SAG 52.96 = DSM 107014 TaxID=1521640 RepID=A0A941GVG2_9CHRO|nr:Uma2 family endonuclease [Gomphosphaeria aponina SAG 52.96 = DSM 107014]